jgi:hypothetical protein
MAKASFSPMAPARRGSELLAAIGTQLEAVPSALPTGNATRSTTSTVITPIALTEPEAPEPLPKPAPFVLRLSPDVLRQIDAKAVDEGVTMTVVIARALMAAGFSVPEDDLKDRRKRRYRG